MARKRWTRQSPLLSRTRWTAAFRRRLWHEPLEERTCLSAFYHFEVLAEPGQDNVVDLSVASINDRGKVAVAAELSVSGDRILLADGSVLTDVTPATDPSTRFLGAFINNNNQILAGSQFLESVEPPAGGASLHRWDAASPGAATLIARSRTPIQGPDFPDSDPNYNPDDFRGFPGLVAAGLADDGQVAFAGLDGELDEFGGVEAPTLTFELYLSSSKVDRGDSGAFDSIPDIGANGVSMFSADGDRVLVAVEESSVRRIVLHDLSGFDTSEPIASTSGGPWTSLGMQPGISDDGSVVVFAGNQGSGPGIFASIEQADGPRVLIRVAGENGGATKYPELGYDAAGMPLSIGTLDFGKLGVVVHHRSGGNANALDPGESFVVSFQGTPSAASRNNPITGQPLLFSDKAGLWTIQVQARPALSPGGATEYFTTSALPVLQVGDVIDGVSVTGFQIFDPISNARADLGGFPRAEQPGDHYLAFTVTTTAGTRLIRASQFDTDGDGLFDHWEQQGIDIDQDGTIDLDLPGIGADPKHKDLFLEIDWLQDDNPTSNIADSRTFEPQPEAIDFLVTTFANAPVSNPDGTKGITVHVDGGQFLERNMAPSPGAPSLLANLQGGDTITQAGTGNHIHVIYFGTEGSVSFPGMTDSFGRPIVARSFESIKENFFGTTSKWARELAFRYVVFGDRHSDPTKGSSGRAEISWFNSTSMHTLPGNDYMVTLQGQLDPAALTVPLGGPLATVPTPLAFLQGQTLMHELGHTLGLRHGGVDNDTSDPPEWPTYNPAMYKPAYRSLMNYAYQFAPATDATLVRDYSGPGDVVYDDWSNIQLGFSRYFDNLGNTDNLYSRLGSGAAEADLPEPSLEEIEVVHGPLDRHRPTVTIALAANTAVSVGTNLLVPVLAADDIGIASIVIAFDADGNGEIDPAAEQLVAAPLSNDRYQVEFLDIGGPIGPRTVTSTVTDLAGRRRTETAEVHVEGSSPNQPPIARDDGPLDLATDTQLVIDLLANDSDPDGDALSIQQFTDPQFGSVTDHGDGTVTYTPPAGFSGSDSFQYTLADSHGATAVATVTINVAGSVASRVTAQVVKGKLVLVGDDAATCLVLELGLQGNNSVQISGRDGTLINGQDGPVVFVGLKNGIDARTAGGNDCIEVRGANFQANIRLDGGDGDDIYRLATNRAAIQIADSGGADWLDFSAASHSVKAMLLRDNGQSQAIGGGNKLRLRGQFEHAIGSSFNDKLWGNAAANILIANGGNDQLYGEGGRDLLIGGLGRDRLHGGDGEDILIGDRTAFDGNAAALLAILAEWNAHRPFAVRQHNLTDGTGSGDRLNELNFLESGVTVLDDLAADVLLGNRYGPHQDWLLSR